MNSHNLTWVRHFVWGVLAMGVSGWPWAVISWGSDKGEEMLRLLVVGIPFAVMFVSGWLLSALGRTTQVRIIGLFAFPLHTALTNCGVATPLLRPLPPSIAVLVYLLSIPACVAIGCVTVLRIQRAICGPANSPQAEAQP